MIRTERSSFQHVALRGGRCSSSFLSPGPRKRPVRTFLRSYRGTHPLGRSALSLLRCGERPRGYPDVASGRCAGTLRPWGRERLLEVHVRKTRSPVIPARKGGIVRSDIRVPEAKRGRVPCRNEDDTCLSKARSVQNQAEPCIPCRTREHERGAASHTGDSASFVRTGSAEKLSLPHRTQPESAHARGRRQPDRG